MAEFSRRDMLGAAAGAELPRRDTPIMGRRLGERDNRGAIPGLAIARRSADVACSRRLARAALARQCGGVGVRDQGAMPRDDHQPAGPIAGRRFCRRRRPVFSARIRPLDPGHRHRGLPLRPGIRQRIFLRVRHVQHQRLDRAYAARSAGEVFRRIGGDVRKLPQKARSIYPRDRYRCRFPPFRRPARSTTVR